MKSNLKIMRRVFASFIIVFALSVSGFGQQQGLQVDVTQITAAYSAILKAQSDAQLDRLKATVESAVAILQTPIPAGATPAEQTAFIEFRGELAKLVLAGFQNATASQIELSQLVDTFLRSTNRIEIALSVTTPVNTSFGFGTERESKDRAVSYVRLLTNSANGATDMVARLIALIDSSQSNAVAILNQLSDLIQKVQAQ